MYGIKLQDPQQHHLNSKGNWTSLGLPNASGDWMEFETRKEAEEYAKKHAPADYEIVELS